MVTLNDLAPEGLFASEVEEGFIRVQTHPILPLSIYNYTEKVQFTRRWNAATLASRGLILDSSTHEVIARPFSKFFNHGESDMNSHLLEGPVNVTDKMDGSLGIAYPDGAGFSLSTRGSFASDQALHATRIYKERYEGAWEPREGYTYLWEIIYPENRIVVSYGDLDDLVLLGAVNIQTGLSLPASALSEWKWQRTQEFPYYSMVEVLASPNREGKEGMVVHYLETDVRVKYKQEDYVRLHRIVTGVTDKRVWEMMVEGQDFDSWLSDLPDEFTTFVNATRAVLQSQFDSLAAQADLAHKAVLASLSEGYSQKDFALASQAYAKEIGRKEILPLLFSLEAGRPERVTASIWKYIEPRGDAPSLASAAAAEEA